MFPEFFTSGVVHSVVFEMASLAERLQIGQIVVGDVVIEMSNGQLDNFPVPMKFSFIKQFIDLLPSSFKTFVCTIHKVFVRLLIDNSIHRIIA